MVPWYMYEYPAAAYQHDAVNQVQSLAYGTGDQRTMPESEDSAAGRRARPSAGMAGHAGRSESTSMTGVVTRVNKHSGGHSHTL